MTPALDISFSQTVYHTGDCYLVQKKEQHLHFVQHNRLEVKNKMGAY